MLARHDAGLDPHDLDAAGVRAVAGAADLAAARRRLSALTVEPPVRAYVVDLVRATRVAPARRPRGVAARRHRPAARVEGVGVARRPPVRHPRRGEGGRQARPATPPPAAPRGRARRGHRPTPSSTASSPACRRRADARPDAAARLVALGLAVLRLVLPDDLPGGLLLLNGVLLVVAIVDWAVPCRRRRSRSSAPRRPWSRSAPRPSCGGGCATAPGGPCASGWPTSWRRRCGPAAAGSPCAPAAGTATVRTTVRPSRRGRFTPTEVVVRTDGPLGLVARQAGRAVPGLVRVYPPFRSRDEAELRIEKARILEVGLRSARGRGTGTEFDQLRDYGPDDDHRRIDWSATARTGPTDRAHLPRRAQPGRRPAARRRAHDGRPGRRRAAARARHGRRHVRHHRRHPARRPHRARRLRRRRPRRRAARRRRAPARPRHRGDVRPRAAAVESDVRGAFTTAVARFKRRSMLILLTDLVEQVGGGVAAARAAAGGAPPPRARRRRAGPRRRRLGDAAPPTTPRPPTARPPPSPPSTPGRGRRRACAPSASSSSTPPPVRLAPMLTDAYLDAKAVGRLLECQGRRIGASAAWRARSSAFQSPLQ